MTDNLFTLIIYTTKYRLGGSQFPVVAETLAEEKRRDDPAIEVVTRAVESKHDVLGAIAEIKEKGGRLKEFIFVGHSGMYGPMFGTVKFPEQFSPYEWEQMEIPFAEDGSASFYCCRSARWFAPFFARTQNVPAHGFFWYTTFSKNKDKFVSAGTRTDAPLYTIGCKGRKSHGYAAALKKRLGQMPAEEIKRFEPKPPDGDTSYDHVAELYDAVFEDIRVRRDEWEWLSKHLPTEKVRVLDIGCGNGALLNALSPRIGSGVGVDESGPMIEQARKRNADRAHLQFQKIDGPKLLFPDAEFDVVISMMSFRYLDWDPLLAEIKRVTKQGGKFLIVDMVTVPVAFKEYPKLLLDKAKEFGGRRSNAKYEAALKRLVADPAWQKMVEYNPIRSEHEMKWYLESRFPGQKAEILNIGWNSRILAFDSGPIELGVEAKLTYP
ncbi:MAG: methyltransferase domain-containing protein [Acidobacteria bacterium]|nr:methyltransferase domain-containing protein [Acidobacteriota bacterium]